MHEPSQGISRATARPKHEAATRLVRKMIEDGTLKPGSAAPSAAALARETGCSRYTGRAALRALLADGTLVPGVTLAARPRVAQPDRPPLLGAETLRAALSSTLAARRRAAGMTQPELAAKIGRSVTSIGHAETGRVWQSRRFWMLADQALGDIGDLLRMYDSYTAAKSAEPQEDAIVGVVMPVSVTITPVGVIALWPDGTETVARPPAPAADQDGSVCAGPVTSASAAWNPLNGGTGDGGVVRCLRRKDARS